MARRKPFPNAFLPQRHHGRKRFRIQTNAKKFRPLEWKVYAFDSDKEASEWVYDLLREGEQLQVLIITVWDGR